jgi:hypothetical protein
MVRRRREVVDRLRVGQVEHRPQHRWHAGQVRPAGTGVEVGRNRAVAEIGETAGKVADMLDQPGGLVDHHDPGAVAGIARPRQIGRDYIGPASDLDVLGNDPARIPYGARHIGHLRSTLSVCFRRRIAPDGHQGNRTSLPDVNRPVPCSRPEQAGTDGISLRVL